MIDFSRIIPLFGQPSDSAEVASLLQDLNSSKPKLDSGDVKAWLSAPQHAIDMVFTDEATFHRRADLALGEGALLLTSVALRSNVPD